MKLDAFEGPFDLLLHLIDKAEVDIYEVSISSITDQYLHVLDEAKAWSMEVASEFMVMAATLLALKSRMLLPPTISTEQLADEEAWSDPREELIERLLVYKQFKRLSDQLEERETEQNRVFSREPLDLTPFTPAQNPLVGVKPTDLWKVLFEMIERKKTEVEPTLTTLAREEISVSDRMEQIFQLLLEQRELSFLGLLEAETPSRERLITNFLAILELMKTKPIICTQDVVFADIHIRLDETRESD